MKYEITVRMECDRDDAEMYFNALLEDLQGIESVKTASAKRLAIEIESSVKDKATLQAALKPVFSSYVSTVRVVTFRLQNS